MKYLLLASALICCLPSAVNAGGPRRGSVQDLIFFGNNGPVLMRLQVEVNGQPTHQLFVNYIHKWVRFMDRDKDNMLNATELSNLPNSTYMQQLFRTGYYYPVANRSNLKMTDLGKTEADKITAAELLAYYQRAGVSSFQIAPSISQAQSQNKTGEALFNRLDTNSDGKLSKHEIANGMKALQKLDLDDDEMIAENELDSGATGNAYYSGGGIRLPGGNARGRTSIPSAFYVVSGGKSPAQLTALILAKYDANKDTKLSRNESGMDGLTFQRLDINKDNQLGITELILFLSRAQPVPVVVRLGTTLDKQQPIEIAASKQAIAGAGASITKTSQEDVHLLVGDAKISVHRIAQNASYMKSSMSRNVYAAQFKAANPRNKPFLTRPELTGNVRFRFLLTIFDMADKNGDGKLALEELNELSALNQEARTAYTSIRISEEGRSLFQFMDVNRDRKLSHREIISVWQHLQPLDRNKNDYAELREFVPQYVIAVNRGSAYFGMRQPQVTYNPNAVIRRSTRGPLWFQRMDANNDGDVSAREFLGPQSIFRQLDTDGDGLLDPAEAENAAHIASKE